MLLRRNRAKSANTKHTTKSGTQSSVEVAQEIYRKNVELAHTNQTLSLLRRIDSLVLETDNTLDELLQGIAGALVSSSGYQYSAVFMKNGSMESSIVTLAGFATAEATVIASRLVDNLKAIRPQVNDEWLRQGSSVLVTEGGRSEHMHEGVLMGASDSLIAINKSCDVQSMCILKLVASKKLVGVLVVGLQVSPKDMHAHDYEYLGRVGEASGIAIDNKLLFEENKRVLKELRRTNDKLKALDETKDEFISMASHQLRTPLTSVKGYISMVLEGDAGPLNEQQEKLLTQAFISSQRMVYLIADLLNVSRLRTGKFVIERTQVSLPDIVSGELDQLHEVAKAKGLELVFDPPKDFPTISLDETKIRQVIMNFIDNAMYYTMAGGKIKLELEAKRSSVEFRVVDNGVGVPKEEQHHMFTKFYRANNARRMRPDGTGLGLFMAKKVIIAQGGAIVFKSVEGKGSTFGFTFPRT